MVPKLPGMPVSEQPYGWLLDNRGKRGLALDLAKSEGQAVLHRLAAGADVFITNYPLAVRKKLAIDHERLAALNPRLIYASFTGYGETGAEAAKPGFDVTAYWARSGLMDMVRSDASTPPARALAGMGDHPSGVSLFAAIALALYERERSGRGGMVGSSLLANGIWSNGIMAQAALCGATFTPRPPREKLFNALGCYYRCRDGRWLLLAIVNEQRDWPTVAKCLGPWRPGRRPALREAGRPLRALGRADRAVRSGLRRARPRRLAQGVRRGRHRLRMRRRGRATSRPTGRCTMPVCWCRSRTIRR